MRRQAQHNSRPTREADPRVPVGAGLLASVALHLGLLLALVPLLRQCAQEDQERLLAMQQATEESVQIVEEEPEVVEAQRSPQAEAPTPERTPEQAQELRPEVPKPEPEPKPTPRPQLKPEPNMLMVDQPKVEKEEEPPDAKALGPQNRRVLLETQPRERSLRPSQEEEEPKEEPKEPPKKQKALPKEEQRDEQVKAEQRGKEEDPKVKPEPKAQRQVKTQEEEDSPQPPSAARQAQREGDPGDKGGNTQPKGDTQQEPDAQEAPSAGSQRAAQEEAPGESAEQGEAGENSQVDVAAALRIDPGRYQEVFGQRDAAALKRQEAKPRRMLGHWEKRVAAMKASMENFVPHVRYGNQVAINTRRSVYAAYIARIHREIHALWGNGYLRHLDLHYGGGHPLSNPKLLTKVEMVMDAQTGEIKEAIIVDTSGNANYDAEAVRVSLSVSPAGPAPEAIVSPGNRVYLHWNYWRDTRQCGTFGVSVFVLNRDGSLDTWKVREELDDLNEHHPKGSKPQRHQKPGPSLGP